MTRIGDIIPPYVLLRARVALILSAYLARAEAAEDAPLVAVLTALADEVLDALDPEIQGGDIPRI